jgi:hypothetical protein
MPTVTDRVCDRAERCALFLWSNALQPRRDRWHRDASSEAVQTPTAREFNDQATLFWGRARRPSRGSGHPERTRLASSGRRWGATTAELAAFYDPESFTWHSHTLYAYLRPMCSCLAGSTGVLGSRNGVHGRVGTTCVAIFGVWIWPSIPIGYAWIAWNCWAMEGRTVLTRATRLPYWGSNSVPAPDRTRPSVWRQSCGRGHELAPPRARFFRLGFR